MTQTRKNFIFKNDPFVCDHCGFENHALKSSCRNHCRQCLYSKHVDEEVPGDRLSACLALMKPIALERHKKKGQMIVHECLTCSKKIRNMVAPDDDLELIIHLGLQPSPF